MDKRDRKLLKRIAWEAKLRAPRLRAQTFKSGKEYRRKPKHGKWGDR